MAEIKKKQTFERRGLRATLSIFRGPYFLSLTDSNPEYGAMMEKNAKEIRSHKSGVVVCSCEMVRGGKRSSTNRDAGPSVPFWSCRATSQLYESPSCEPVAVGPRACKTFQGLSRGKRKDTARENLSEMEGFIKTNRRASPCPRTGKGLDELREGWEGEKS